MSLVTIIQFTLAAFVILFAARLLVRACDEIAQITGLGHLFVGSLFLAASTSAPELFIDIRATVAGLPNLAAGDLLGSSIINITIFSVLILGYRANVKEVLSGTTFILLLSALLTIEVGAVIYAQPDFELWGISPISYVIILTYAFGLRFVYQRDLLPTHKDHVSKNPKKLVQSITLFLAATIVMAFASPLLVTSIDTIGHETGLGATLIGTSLLALTTSFPELISSVVAARKKMFRMVAGNIIGSNALNMVIFALMDFAWKESNLWHHISSLHLITVIIIVLNMLILAGASIYGKAQSAAVLIIATLSLNVICYGLMCFLK